MDYFELGNKQEPEFQFIYDKTDTSEYFISKEDEEIKALAELSIPSLDEKGEQKMDPSSSDVSLKLEVPVHELEENMVDDGKILISKINEMESSPVSGKPSTGTVPVCRLCAQKIYDEEMTYLHETSSDDTTTIVDKINACLPISVSLEDSLPKQICYECLINLESSYIFSLCVTSAEEKLRRLHFCSDAENMNCPLCCEGCMEAVPPEINFDDGSSDEFSQPPDKCHVKVERMGNEYERNSMVNPTSFSNLQTRKRGRPRKSDYAKFDKDDRDWTLNHDLEPARKKRASSSRGRPKGSRNRATKLKNMDCFICHFKFNDYEEALSHALSAHCDSVNETFPCPLCQSIANTEQELRDHVETQHNDKKDMYLMLCKLCGLEFGQVDHLHKHIIQAHNTFSNLRCPLCDFKGFPMESVLVHVFQEHQDTSEPDLTTCPVCTLVFQSEPQAKQHFADAHIVGGGARCCPACNTEVGSEDEYLNHFVEDHCSLSIYKLPLTYSCCICSNNFRSQYHLIKHTCNVVAEELFCSDCDKGFPTKARFVFHLQIHQSAGQTMRCDECLAVFTNEDTFYDHVRFQHEPDEQVTCELCQKVFKNVGSLAMHMRRHQPNRDHECEECGKRFQNAQTLREHSVSHMSVKPFQCHICGQYLSRLSRLRIHLRTHSVKASKASMKAYKCSVCTQLFPNTKAAVKHSESHTDVNKINLEELEVNLVFRCEFCDACFQQTTELNLHRKKNHSNPSAQNAFTCSVCGAQFSTYARVTTHKLSHGINTETLIVPDEGVEPTSSLGKSMINQENKDLLVQLKNIKLGMKTPKEENKSLISMKNSEADSENVDSAEIPLRQNTEANPIESDTLSSNFINDNKPGPSVNKQCKRHKQAVPEKWEINITKQRRMFGQQYIGFQRRKSDDGRVIVTRREKEKRKIGPPCTSDVCKRSNKRHCEHFSDDDRKNIFKEFWSMTWKEKQVYVKALVSVTYPKTRKGKDPTRRLGTFFYHLNHKGITRPVCKKFFLSTLGLREWMALNWIGLKKNREDCLVAQDFSEIAMDTGEETFVIPQYFLCHECDKRCLHYTYMSLHRRFQHASGKPIYTCTICGDKFATSWSLQFHRKKQHNLVELKDMGCEGEGVNNLYHCRVCDKPYVTETSLEHHVRKCHETEDGDDPASSYICETCGKTFQFKSALDAHADAHRGMKRFKCSHCDKRFTHRAGLIRHMKLHSETDTFECEFCGKKFRDRTERENHRRAHTGERPYMCDVCGRTFHTRAVWLDHSRIHQDIRPYQCDLCNQTFRRSYALKSHYLIHTGERPFSCEICGKTFRLKQTLFAHKKKEHQSTDDSGQIILPDEVLLIEEDSRYVDELPGVEDCDSLMGKNYMDSELVDNPAPATSVVKSEWRIDPKQLLNRVAEGSVKGMKSGQFQHQKYSLLLKSQQIDDDLS